MENQSIVHPITVGFFTSNLTSKLSRDILEGIELVIQKENGNVLCFSGDLLEQQSEHSFANAIYEIAAVRKLDGLIIYGGDIGQHITDKDLAGFCNRFSSIPLVNIAVELPGITSVISDNYSGMYELVEHVVTVHKYKTIAFIKGPHGHNEAEIRFKAFSDVLGKHGLSVNPELITTGDFSIESGKKSVAYFLNEKRIIPQIIICADDDTAIGAYLELEKRGMRIPEECAITGFDDTAMGNTLLNPLTTVHQPVVEQGKAAAQFVLDKIRKYHVPDTFVIKTKKIIRRSCGCYETIIQETKNDTSLHTKQQDASGFEPLIKALVRINEELHLFASTQSIYTIITDFQKAVALNSDLPFLRSLQLIHADLNPENDFIFYLQEFVTLFKDFVQENPAFEKQKDFLNALFHKARIIINQISERRKSYLHYQAIEKYTALGYTNSFLNTASDWNTFVAACERIAEEYFLQLEISSFFLCLYVDPLNPLQQSKLVFAYEENEEPRCREDTAIFDTAELLPKKYQHIVKRKNCVINPLYFSHEHIGYTIIDTPVRNSFICDILSWQYSSALKRIQLFLEMIQRTKEAEDSLHKLQETQKELVEAEKMASLGTLVTGVSHEINTPLGAGVTYASYLQEITQEIKNHFQSNTLKKSQVRQYLDDALQTSQGILLNLKRAAELVNSFKNIAVDRIAQDKRVFNVRLYINEILISLSSKFKKTKHVITVQCDEHLEIYSYPGVFSQIMLNFIMNTLLHGFEDMEKGEISIAAAEENKVFTLAYSDNGKGMDAETAKKIFDPFFTTKRGQGGSGLGLYIVYNLVTQTLHGTIECSSQPQKGTSFTVTFPLDK